LIQLTDSSTVLDLSFCEKITRSNLSIVWLSEKKKRRTIWHTVYSIKQDLMNAPKDFSVDEHFTVSLFANLIDDQL
jgi:hypothetical protein